MPAAIPAVAAAAASASAAGAAAGVGALTATAFTIAGTAVSVGTVLSVGFTLLGTVAQLALSSGSSRSGISQSADFQTTFSEETTARFFLAGRGRIGGALAFWEIGSENTPNLYRMIVNDCGTTTEIERQFLNNEPVTLDAEGWVQTPGKWRDRIRIQTTDGTQTEALPTLLDNLNQWTEDHVGRGLSITAIQQQPVPVTEVRDIYPNGAVGENYTDTRKGAALFDPRDGETRWSRNGALVVMWALMHVQFGGLALDDFSLESWKAAADECDRPIQTVSGNSIPQYTLSGTIQAPAPADSSAVIGAISEMLLSIDASIYEDPLNDGKLAIRVGNPPPNEDGPLTTLEVLTWEDDETEGLLEAYDAVRIRYTDPELGFSANITPPYGMENPQNILTLERTFIDNFSQAQRMAKKEYLRLVNNRVARADVNMIGVLMAPSDTWEFDLPNIPAGERYRVLDRNISLSDQPSIQVGLELISPEYDVWDAETEEVALDRPPLQDEDGETITAPTSLGAGSFANGQVRVMWSDQPTVGVAAEVEWSLTGQNTFTVAMIIDPARQRVAEIDVPQDQTIDVRVRFVDVSGASTDYSRVEGISTANALPATAAPNLGNIPPVQSPQPSTINAVCPDDVGVFRVQFFSDGEFVSAPLAVAGASVKLEQRFPVGTHVITTRIVNLSGVVSPDSIARNLVVKPPEPKGE